MQHFASTAKAAVFAFGVCALTWGGHAQAALFEDADARRAILEMRQRVDSLQQSGQRSVDEARKLAEDNVQLRRSLLELQNQIDVLKTEQSKLRGGNEQMLRDVVELQRRQKDIAQGVDERLKQFEPIKVTVDGQEFLADPAEKRDFDAAMAIFRLGKFADAAVEFNRFLTQFPRSGYLPAVRFWLGNSQYANREFKGAIAQLKLMLAEFPAHPRASEAALAIANCQIELKETRAARKTLEDLIAAYPRTEAAAAAKERLSRMK